METQLRMHSSLHDELVSRRLKLESVLSQAPTEENFHLLLKEVDAALERIEQGTYGLCETCHEPIEAERLAVDPLVRTCLDHLSRQEQRALERDLDLAFQIQKQLLPEADLVMNGWRASYRYEPAGAVSGDYVDCFMPPGADALHFTIGDVTGKGVAASILMGHLHAMFRSLALADLPLCDAVMQANRIFCEGTASSHFATLVAGRAHADGTIELCNAGHPYPVIRRAGGAVEVLPSLSMPIGLFSTSEFASLSIRLEPRDMLILYTDGLTEAENPAGEQYGEERLLNLLGTRDVSSPRSLLDAAAADVTAFSNGARKTDDLTMLVLERH